MIVKIKKSDVEMFRAFINQCEGDIIVERPWANPRVRARAELQPPQQPSEATEEIVQAPQEGNSRVNGKKLALFLVVI